MQVGECKSVAVLVLCLCRTRRDATGERGECACVRSARARSRDWTRLGWWLFLLLLRGDARAGCIAKRSISAQSNAAQSCSIRPNTAANLPFAFGWSGHVRFNVRGHFQFIFNSIGSQQSRNTSTLTDSSRPLSSRVPLSF